MKERGITYTGPSICAILGGQKTVTRRLIRNPGHCKEFFAVFPNRGVPYYYRRQDAVWDTFQTIEELVAKRCPWGVPGDRLYAKETWRMGAWDENTGQICVDYRADGYCRKEWLETSSYEQFERLWQQSTDDAMKAGRKMDGDGDYRWKPGESPCRWRSGRFMPKWASRITQDILDIGAEQLQDITEEEAIAEGVDAICMADVPRQATWSRRHDFAQLWDRLHKKGPHGWEGNPYVWPIHTKLLKET